MSRSAILATALVAVSIVACGSAVSPAPPAQLAATSPGPSSGAAPASSASPSAAVTLTQDQIRTVAKAAYLAAVKPEAKAYASLYKAYQKTSSLAGARKYCAGLVAVDHKVLLALTVITFPDDTAADAKLFIRYVAAQEADERTCSKAKTWSDWTRFDKLAIKANERAHEAANLVRLDLGLPTVSG
jgi:hypothetical protein